MEAVERDIKPWIEVIDSENRRYPRIDIHLPVEYYSSKSFSTHTGNISEGGLLIYFREEMDVNQYLRLKLFFTSGSEMDTIETVVQVVWMDIHLRKDAGGYRAGVKFVDISSQDATKLRNFIGSLSSPLNDMLCLLNALKVRFWIWKFMNPPRSIFQRGKNGKYYLW